MKSVTPVLAWLLLTALLPAQQPDTRLTKDSDAFVRVQDVDPTIIVELRYATDNNFTGKRVYPHAVCLLRRETAAKLAKANAWFTKRGYRIKVWDAFRPMAVQKIFWDLVPNSHYVANPHDGGSRHNRGGAVDITLVDEEGNEIKMPSAFDDFSDAASPTNPKMNRLAWKHINLLQTGMMKAGFQPNPYEWWHFDDKDWRDYPLADIDMKKFATTN